MREHKRGEVRWTVSSHTAELAIGAIEAMNRPKAPPRKRQIAATEADETQLLLTLRHPEERATKDPCAPRSKLSSATGPSSLTLLGNDD